MDNSGFYYAKYLFTPVLLDKGFDVGEGAIASDNGVNEDKDEEA